MIKLIKKLIIRIIVLIVLAVGGFAVYLIDQGHKKFEEAIDILPVADVASKIMYEDNYYPIEKIDDDFVHALVAIEDHRFFEREGIDFISIGRALFSNIISGRISQGGSTITQQLAKNIYFTHAKSLNRKIAEVFFVEEFEKYYSHDEIFSMYANIIYYGDGYSGIYDASKGYLKKDPSDLTIYEASLLAGMPQSPSKYQLSNGYSEINKRQKLVLKAMLKYGYINDKEYEEALLLQPQE